VHFETDISGGDETATTAARLFPMIFILSLNFLVLGTMSQFDRFQRNMPQFLMI